MPTTIVRREKAPVAITTKEAAWLTELSIKAINASIDRGELAINRGKRESASGRERRILAPADVVYLALRKDITELLSSRAKSELYEQLVRYRWSDVGQAHGSSDNSSESRADIEIALAGGLIRIELKNTYRRLAKRWTALQDANELVVSDPQIRGGEPVIRNTRIPVYLIAELMQQGASLKEILEDFPSLNASKVRSALAYAQTHPRRGRPRKAPP